MSKKTAPENLNQELAALPKALENLEFSEAGQTVILARVLHGLSRQAWQKASSNLPLDEWHALPVEGTDEDIKFLDDGPAPALDVTPFREVHGILTKTTFLGVLHREILRLGRVGGSLSVLGACIVNRDSAVTALGESAVKKLDSLLGQTLLSGLDACDGVGLLKEGVFLCSLPGMGQLAARQFAEHSCASFANSAQPYFPAGGISAGKGCDCAIGIVNIMQGDPCNTQEIVKRARNTLEIAMGKDGVHIHQETAFTPLSGPTLVHSSEKRFLFFGGDPK